jgi:hypothetical protein
MSHEDNPLDRVAEATYAHGYAVVQLGYAVYGIGPTREAAIADAMQWVDYPAWLTDDLTPVHQAVVGDLVVVPCDDALIAYHTAPNANPERCAIVDGIATLPDAPPRLTTPQASAYTSGTCRTCGTTGPVLIRDGSGLCGVCAIRRQSSRMTTCLARLASIRRERP